MVTLVKVGDIDVLVFVNPEILTTVKMALIAAPPGSRYVAVGPITRTIEEIHDAIARVKAMPCG